MIEREQRILAEMVGIYCRHHEGNRRLCADCLRLVEYAHGRLRKCPFGDAKPTCRHCRVHCYEPRMRARITEVMRWTGPRVILYRPGLLLTWLRHMKG